MPTTIVPLAEWLPDLPGGVSIANNVRAIANGYAPVGAPQAATNALGSPTFPFMGGGSFIDSTGNSTLLAARTDSVFKYTGTSWSGIATGGTQQVRFAQFGDNVIIANGGALQRYVLTSGALGSITDAPNAIDAAPARDFVMAITTDNALQWCQFGDSSTWTTGTNQADKQPSLWGQLRRIIGGEYIIALTDCAVIRGTYVGVEGGLDIIWQFDQISAEVGCMASGSVARWGRFVWFLDERGFMECDGQMVVPIADEKFNRWFFSTYSRSDIANIWAAVDPRYSVVMWAMPGTPGRIIVYNWVLKKATTFQMDVRGIFSGFTSGISLDSLDAIYGNLDAIPVSLDDALFQGGNPQLFVVDSSNVLNALTGSPMQATFKLDNIEPSPGIRSRIRSLRPISDTRSASAIIDARMGLGDAESDQTSSPMRSNGKMPIRSNGRYNNVTLTIPAGQDWSFIQGVELEFDPGDAR